MVIVHYVEQVLIYLTLLQINFLIINIGVLDLSSTTEFQG